MAERQSINPDCSLEKAHKDMPFNFKTNRWINLFKVFLFLKLIVGSTFSKFFSSKKLPFCRVDLLSPSVLSYKETSCECRALCSQPISGAAREGQRWGVLQNSRRDNLEQQYRQSFLLKAGSQYLVESLLNRFVLAILMHPADLQQLIKLAATCWDGCQAWRVTDRMKLKMLARWVFDFPELQRGWSASKQERERGGVCAEVASHAFHKSTPTSCLKSVAHTLLPGVGHTP